ncbi:MAG: PIN domain-containing protein [Alphaproteobacteria bacterium]|nr:PIN domain-containing protein [Alphaproteobacteria bacterium]TAD90879.1 MAG: PIN domain-containing protein [Alphaproteobacteria bacterium]
MTQVVFDATALLALLEAETPHQALDDLVGSAVLSAIGADEVLTVLGRRGVPLAQAMALVIDTGIHIVDFTYEHATAAARIQADPAGAALGVSARAALALGLVLDATVVTADPALERFAHLGVRVAPVA